MVVLRCLYMAWLEKTETNSFENDPIEGLFFLHGSLIAAVVGRDWTIDQKYPLIAFPSGLEFDLWEGSKSPIIHLFGEMDLALRSTRDEAFEYANYVAEQCGYFVSPVGESQLELISYEDHLLVTYDNVQRRMVDVTRVKQASEGKKAEARLSLGQIVATPGALEALQEAGQEPSELLARHLGGDWGDLSAEDKELNDQAIAQGNRILSAYRLKSGLKVWVITEADRSSSTILMPSEY